MAMYVTLITPFLDPDSTDVHVDVNFEYHPDNPDPQKNPEKTDVESRDPDMVVRDLVDAHSGEGSGKDPEKSHTGLHPGWDSDNNMTGHGH